MVESTLTGRRSPGDAASRLRYKDQGGRYDSTPYASPGGAGSQSYWGATGTGAEHKYHYQKGAHGAFDELGYTEKIPQGGIAPFAQFESERIVAQRNARLMGEAVTTIGDARSNALGRMESYRPGGAAALASGIDMQAGMGMANMLAASRTEAPDLLYQNRRDRSRRAAQKARQMQYIQLAVQGGLAAAALIPGVGGAGALAAGLTAAGNVGTALINKGESGQQQLQGTGGGASSFKQVPQTEQQKKQDALGGAQGFIEVPKDQQQQQQGKDQGSQLQSQGGAGLLGGGGVAATGALSGMPGGAPGGPGSGSQLGGSPGGGPGGPTSPGVGPITATGGPISMPSVGGGDPGDVSSARVLRDAQASGIDLISLQAEIEGEMDEEHDDFLGFLELWNADLDALLYAG